MQKLLQSIEHIGRLDECEELVIVLDSTEGDAANRAEDAESCMDLSAFGVGVFVRWLCGQCG